MFSQSAQEVDRIEQITLPCAVVTDQAGERPQADTHIPDALEVLYLQLDEHHCTLILRYLSLQRSRRVHINKASPGLPSGDQFGGDSLLISVTNTGRLIVAVMTLTLGESRGRLVGCWG